MTTIIVGNIDEAIPYWGTVEFMKHRMVMQYAEINPYMNEWRFLSSTVRVFIKLVAGKPFAYIYSEKGGIFILALRGFEYDLDAIGIGHWGQAMIVEPVGTDFAWEPTTFGFPIATDPPEALHYSISSDHKTYLVLGSTIYKDKSAKFTIPGGVIGKTPITYPGNENTVFLVDGSVITPLSYEKNIDGTDVVPGNILTSFIYEWDPSVIVSGYRYDSNIFIDTRDSMPWFHFLTMLETPAGAVQRWQASLQTFPIAPWAYPVTPETFTQVGVYGDFITTGGGIAASFLPSSSPGPVNNQSLQTWTGGGGFWYFNGFIHCGGPVAGGLPIEGISYSKALSDSYLVEVIPDIELTASREMTSSASFYSGFTSWYGTWPHSDFIGTSTDVEALYRWRGVSSGRLYQGEQVGNAMAGSDGSWGDSIGTSLTKIESIILPKDIQNVSTQTTRSGFNGDHTNMTGPVPYDLGPISLGGGDPSGFTFVGLVSDPFSAPAATINYSLNMTVDMQARDYIYTDFSERVFIYIEMLAVGGSVDVGSGVSGSSDISLNIVLDYRGVLYKYVIYTLASNMRMSAPEKAPDDINFGTMPVQAHFTNPNPKMPKIIFSPRWTAQGHCPYIAYTTTDEIATLIISKVNPDQMIFTMRLQVVRERRGLFESPPNAPTPPLGTEVFFVPTIERVCGEYGLQVKALFDEIEKLWPVIRFSKPSVSQDWIKTMQPSTWPVSPVNPLWAYPSNGIYDNHDYDITIANVYRA